MIRYFFRTYYRLPPSKFLLKSPAQILPILDEILEAKPIHRKIARYEIEMSCSCITINTEELPEFRKIFIEKPYWNWADLDQLDIQLSKIHKGEKLHVSSQL